ncbi:MAG: hypothetical protein ABSD29_20880 [Verrucomicrobiota bacterium]
MTASLMSNAGTPDPAIREPAPAEVERVLHLFRNVPLSPEARLLAAARSRPIERFIAAAAWWPEGTVGRFQLACQPGVARAGVARLLIDSLAECAHRAGMATIQCANLLTDDNEWFGILRSHGFECLHSERSFEVSYRDAWTRVMQLHQKHRSQIPAGWRTEAIRHHPPETALELIAPHRLMPPAEIRNYWRVNSQFGFELDLSCILFDGERPFGAFLLRRMGEGLYIDVQVVRETNPRLRSLGDLFMLYHDAQRVAADGPIRWLWFRSGATEHRQTANLALRMGGRELARCHLLAKAL